MKFILVTILITFLSFFNLSAQCISGNCQNGIGTYLVNNQGKYVGEFQKSQFLGKGIFYYLNGDKFLGRWANGIQNGKGKLITAEYQYIGQFKNGEFDGFGTLTYNNGQKDQGNFQKGELIERSTYVDDGIATSVNTSVKNEPIVESQATSSYSNQYKYTTNCNNTYCDQEYGTYKYKDGSIYKGFFKQGKPEGSGTVNYTNGNHYEGEWKNHVPNGMGAFVFNDGVRAEGLWSNGKFLQEKEIHNTRSSQIPNQQVVQSDEAKIYAVVVGVASYNHMPSLKFTDDDAYKMYAFLKSPEGGALPDDQIKILVDDQATKNGILSAMEQLYQKADDNDMVMLYFSGHGLQGSFIPYDFDGYNNKLMHDDLQNIFNKSQAKQKVCYVDACYSGGYANAKALTLEESISNFYSELDEADAGTAFMLSSKENEISLEYKGLRQGVFTHFLMRGLKGEADKDQNKIITINELFFFVQNGVKKYTANVQSPVMNGKYDFGMPVGMIR